MTRDSGPVYGVFSLAKDSTYQPEDCEQPLIRSDEQAELRQFIYDALQKHCHIAVAELHQAFETGGGKAVQEWATRYNFIFKSGVFDYEVFLSAKFAQEEETPFRLYTRNEMARRILSSTGWWADHAPQLPPRTHIDRVIVGDRTIAHPGWTVSPGVSKMADVRAEILEQFTEFLDERLATIYAEMHALSVPGKRKSIRHAQEAAEWLVLRNVLQLSLEEIEGLYRGCPVKLSDGAEFCISHVDLEDSQLSGDDDESDVGIQRRVRKIQQATQRLAKQVDFNSSTKRGRRRARDDIYEDYLA
jgi:hypothetical protein